MAAIVNAPAERAARLKSLAQGWSASVASPARARENLSGTGRTTFRNLEGRPGIKRSALVRCGRVTG